MCDDTYIIGQRLGKRVIALLNHSSEIVRELSKFIFHFSSEANDHGILSFEQLLSEMVP